MSGLTPNQELIVHCGIGILIVLLAALWLGAWLALRQRRACFGAVDTMFDHIPQRTGDLLADSRAFVTFHAAVQERLRLALGCSDLAGLFAIFFLVLLATAGMAWCIGS